MKKRIRLNTGYLATVTSDDGITWTAENTGRSFGDWHSAMVDAIREAYSHMYAFNPLNVIEDLIRVSPIIEE